jgi:tetratricopeptide (TPR) repeat protein
MLARVELAESVRLFEQAVALDPQFAAAWAGLGAAAWIAPSWNVTDRDYLAISRRATKQALVLDENQSMAWAVLSGLRDFDESGPDYETTLNYLDRALQIDPNNTTAWLWRGIAWSELGFHERALKDLQQCLVLDPAYQNCRGHLAMQNIMLNRHERVRELSIQLLRAGYQSAMSAHIPYLVRRGDVLGAAMLVFNLSRHPDFPGEEWLDALQHPEQDHSLAKARAQRWLQADGSARIPITLDLMLAFGDYDHIDTSERHNWNRIWQAGFPGFHESGQFKRIANDLNLPVYWRKHGFPPQCRPLDGEDFECDWLF